MWQLYGWGSALISLNPTAPVMRNATGRSDLPWFAFWSDKHWSSLNVKKHHLSSVGQSSSGCGAVSVESRALGSCLTRSVHMATSQDGGEYIHISRRDGSMERSAFRFKQLTCTWNGNSLMCPDYLGAVQLSEQLVCAEHDVLSFCYARLLQKVGIKQPSRHINW